MKKLSDKPTKIEFNSQNTYIVLNVSAFKIPFWNLFGTYHDFKYNLISAFGGIERISYLLLGVRAIKWGELPFLFINT